ncbi:hypothetical protein EW026_g1405 [Hermanssonia centrifuga]|uniref:Protein kinase domain-containing protein n=1 Tax=Hermanssonia centrifuga TaxID=98765 RepID=A0A4S4KSB5_9APHY|nr:hypothetical protein EW026_g1405 [Hermanssonia centrifuga]
MPQSPPHPEQEDAMALDGVEEALDETQPATQVDSQDVDQSWRSHLRRLDFMKTKAAYQLGRNPNRDLKNDFIFPGLKITTDAFARYYSNGTFINGDKIGKNRFGVLKEGNELAFGSPQPQSGSYEDYRFIFRHLAGGGPNTGLYAHYELTEELGKGSFATVMKAMSKSTGQWYACKMIHVKQVRASVRVDGNGAKERIDPYAAVHKEVQILGQLRHPNICQLKEVFSDETYINIILEWVPGGDLLDYILKKDGLQEDETQHITYQLCDALAYIHRQGIAHRDLKPENVLLTTDDPPIVKVADFGLAKAIDSLTMLRTMCGTPSYLAPEVVQQDPDEGYQQIVDSWSVGVIVFSMLTNASPFIEPTNTTDVKKKILERTIDWDILQQHNLSAAGVDFIRCLLREDPKVRMTLAHAMEHPWLASFRPLRIPVPTRDPTASPTAMPLDVSMKDIPEEDMSLDGPSSSPSHNIPGAYPGGSQQDNPRALQRRRKVLDDARERGEAPPEPTPEMILRAEIEQQQDDDQHYAGHSRPLKRKARKEDSDPLTPLPEEQEEELSLEVSPGTSANGALARRGKAVAAAEGPSGSGKGEKGRGRGKAPQLDGGGEEMEEVSPAPARRSNRLGAQAPQKAARRS